MNEFKIHIPTLSPELGEIKQIAFIVDDIDKAIAKWHKDYGVGPFVVARDESPLTNAYYRGEPSKNIVLDLAFAYIGELQLELICLKNNVDSMYKEVIDRGQIDLQHYGTCVRDFDAAVSYYKANGFSLVVEAGVKGLAQMHYVEAVDFDKNVFAFSESSYMKTPENYGIVLEIIEDNAMTRPYFDGIKSLVDTIPENQRVLEFSLSQLSGT